jgi:hypothetical protein
MKPSEDDLQALLSASTASAASTPPAPLTGAAALAGLAVPASPFFTETATLLRQLVSTIQGKFAADGDLLYACGADAASMLQEKFLQLTTADGHLIPDLIERHHTEEADAIARQLESKWTGTLWPSYYDYMPESSITAQYALAAPALQSEFSEACTARGLSRVVADRRLHALQTFMRSSYDRNLNFQRAYALEAQRIEEVKQQQAREARLAEERKAQAAAVAQADALRRQSEAANAAAAQFAANSVQNLRMVVCGSNGQPLLNGDQLVIRMVSRNEVNALTSAGHRVALV